MKILFLDIDGVLNSDRSFLANSYKTQGLDPALPYWWRITTSTIDPIAVALINRISRDIPEVKIVISSTHRMYFKDPTYWLSDMVKYFRELGITGNIIGRTQRLNLARGHEIQDWIDTHDSVSSYVIVDDSADMLPHQMPNFVFVDASVGLSADNMRQISAILGRPCDDIYLI